MAYLAHGISPETDEYHKIIVRVSAVLNTVAAPEVM